MKRIAILTFQRANNHGAKLQAYALQEQLSRRYESYILDYRSNVIESGYEEPVIGLSSKAKFYIRWVIYHRYMKYQKRQRENFQRFTEHYLKLTDSYYKENIHEVDPQFDAFIAGSDQIWNGNITGGDSTYFLDFTQPKKRYSYAASFGSDKLSECYEKNIKSYLEGFNTILLREKSGFEILSRYSIDCSKSKMVCDPVYLLSREEWLTKLNLNQEKQEYIFVFLVAKDTFAIPFARNLRDKYGCTVKFFSSYGGRKGCPKDFDDVSYAGPIEFLSLILNAKYVVTTSFHAMSFSIIMNVPFFYELNHSINNKNARLENIAEIFELQKREILDDRIDIDDDTIEWNRVNEKIREYREQSIGDLLDSLEGFANES